MEYSLDGWTTIQHSYFLYRHLEHGLPITQPDHTYSLGSDAGPFLSCTRSAVGILLPFFTEVKPGW